jgi:hypothetical protein
MHERRASLRLALIQLICDGSEFHGNIEQAIDGMCGRHHSELAPAVTPEV